LQKEEKKPVVVFLHTSWCKFCGAMKNTTFKNNEVINLLNKKFYFVSFDVEEKQKVFFRGHTFRYKPTGVNTGVHELAEQLGTIKGTLSYPAICFLNTDYEIIHQQEGYVAAKKFVFILNKIRSDN
jgi:thioredoxin-related protein